MEHYDLDRLPQLPAVEDRRPQAIPPGRTEKIAVFVFTFLLFMATWVLLSGRFDWFHLTLGAISCLVVTATSRDLLFPSGRLGRLGPHFSRLLVYLPWLAVQVTAANVHVLKLSFSPRIVDKIDPHLVDLNTRLHSDMAVVSLANSITLTPGTITVQVSSQGDFVIHALDRTTGDPEALHDMARRVAWVFGED
jgi:multicomponent Na+:H+ antiporter subunit E